MAVDTPAGATSADNSNKPSAAGWLERLRPELGGYARVALDNIAREYPAFIVALVTEPGGFPHRPSDRNPVFYGSLDWHSCVEMFWLLVRLLKVAPGDVPAAEIRRVLDARLTGEGLRAEAEFIAGAASERPYGWGWALALAGELATWDDPDARRWSGRLEPLTTTLERNFLDWLPKATYPVRTGTHNNGAFGVSRALAYADLRPDGGLSRALREAARRWFAADEDYPGRYEPSGQDFLSAALCEAELMAKLLPAGEFPEWLGRFLPGLADGEPNALFTPAVVTDASDGYIAHLRGLNLSRAWCWRRLAESLPAADPRVPVCAAASGTHAEASLAYVSGDDYMVEHWLAAYAVLLFS
ncbi:MAG TPA: DUF2891 domain-containing protein [Trebonia sp.]